MIPKADQQIRREADAFPTKEHLQEIVGCHECQHGEGEQRQIGEEARAAIIFGHVADRIDVHEARHCRHNHQHDGGQRIDAQHPADVEIARRDPAHDRHLVRRMPDADLEEHDPRQDRRNQQKRRRDDLARPRPNHTPEQPRNERAEQREKNNRYLYYCCCSIVFILLLLPLLFTLLLLQYCIYIIDCCSIVFWLGDLNYRLSGLEDEVCKQLIKKKDFTSLMNYDQVLFRNTLTNSINFI